MKLIDIAKILRSKNAGPLFITFDMIFQNREDMQKVYRSLTKKQIGEAYGVDPETVDIIPFEIVDSVKVTFPRKIVSGCIAENDVYGCQQHMPLANLEIAEEEK